MQKRLEEHALARVLNDVTREHNIRVSMLHRVAKRPTSERAAARCGALLPEAVKNRARGKSVTKASARREMRHRDHAPESKSATISRTNVTFTKLRCVASAASVNTRSAVFVQDFV